MKAYKVSVYRTVFTMYTSGMKALLLSAFLLGSTALSAQIGIFKDWVPAINGTIHFSSMADMAADPHLIQLTGSDKFAYIGIMTPNKLVLTNPLEYVDDKRVMATLVVCYYDTTFSKWTTAVLPSRITKVEIEPKGPYFRIGDKAPFSIKKEAL